MRAILGAYRRVLANRPLRLLLLGEFVSSIGDWLYLVALLIIIYQRTNNAVLLGIVGAARILPYVFLSIPAGILADRVDRRAILMTTDLSRGALMLVLAWLVASDGSIAAIVAITILATCFSSFFGPAIGAYLPSLVTDETELGPANTAYATLENVAFIVGPALAAIILAASDMTVAFLLNAASFAVVAAILWRLPPSRPGAPAAASPGAGSEQPVAAPASSGSSVTAAGAAPSGSTASSAVGPAAGDAPFSWRSVAAPLGGLVGMDAAESFVFGGLSVLTVVIAFDLLNSGEAATGALNAAVGVGGLVGALVSGALVLRRRLAPPMLLGALILAAGVAVVG